MMESGPTVIPAEPADPAPSRDGIRLGADRNRPDPSNAPSLHSRPRFYHDAVRKSLT